jgi:hypothetical protein
MRRMLSVSSGALVFLSIASLASAQSGRMSNEQQEWFFCLISKDWCVARSVDEHTGEQKTVAMVAAARPLQLSSGTSRATLQIGCSEGLPVTMLHSGREISDHEITINYTLEPTGSSGQLSAKNVGAGHFFEFRSPAFLKDLEGATKAFIKVSFASGQSNNLEFNVVGGAAVLTKLKCISP